MVWGPFPVSLKIFFWKKKVEYFMGRVKKFARVEQESSRDLMGSLEKEYKKRLGF